MRTWRVALLGLLGSSRLMIDQEILLAIFTNCQYLTFKKAHIERIWALYPTSYLLARTRYLDAPLRYSLKMPLPASELSGIHCAK